MKKPIILFVDNLIEPIKMAIRDIESIKIDISSIDKEFILNSLFVYSFALFESSLSDCFKKYLTAFPEKITFTKQDTEQPKNDHKDALLNEIFTYKYLELLIERETLKTFYGSINSILQIFCEKFSIDQISDDIINPLIEKKERRNILIHNNLVINREYCRKVSCSNNDLGKKLKITIQYLIETIGEMIAILQTIEIMIRNKYSTYTQLKVVRDIWNYLFNSSILIFEQHWIIQNNKIVGYNTKYAKKYSNNYSSGEQTLLALFLLNYSESLIGDVLNIRNLKMFCGLDMDKVAYIVEVFDKYPLLLQPMNNK